MHRLSHGRYAKFEIDRTRTILTGLNWGKETDRPTLIMEKLKLKKDIKLHCLGLIKNHNFKVPPLEGGSPLKTELPSTAVYGSSIHPTQVLELH